MPTGFRQFANDIHNKQNKGDSIPTYENFRNTYKPKTSHTTREKLASKDFGDDDQQVRFGNDKTKE